MERFYSIAGSTYRVAASDEWMYCEDGVLTPFRVEDPDHDYDIELTVVEQLTPPEGECLFSDPAKRVYGSEEIRCRYEGAVENSPEMAYLRIARAGDHSSVQVKLQSLGAKITPKLVLNSMETEHRIVQNGGFILHASYIRWQDKSILFSAPSGTGKSTQAELWCRLRDAELLNGDRAVVRWDASSGASVWGTPFSGSSGVSKNVTLPLAAIVILSQAPQTTIEPLTGVRAFRYIWEGCSVNAWDREDMEICTQTVLEIVKHVPIFHLACTPDESAVIALERELERLG